MSYELDLLTQDTTYSSLPASHWVNPQKWPLHVIYFYFYHFPMTSLISSSQCTFLMPQASGRQKTYRFQNLPQTAALWQKNCIANHFQKKNKHYLGNVQPLGWSINLNKICVRYKVENYCNLILPWSTRTELKLVTIFITLRLPFKIRALKQ